MPALPSPGKVIRVRFGMTNVADTNVQNTVYFSYTGSVSGADATSVANTLFTAWGANMNSLLTTEVTLNLITVTDLSSSTGVEVATTGSELGTATGVAVTAGAAVVVKGIVARRYRGGHSRAYISGASTSALANSNTWTTTYIGNFHTGWTTMLDALISSPPTDLGTVAPVQVSYYQGFTPHEYPSGRYRNVPNLRTTPVVDNITSWVVNPKVGSQRRRNEIRT